MFTGIIRNLGIVKQFNKHHQGALLKVLANNAFSDAQTGDSVAINGTCLTIIEHSKSAALFELGPETLKKTNLSLLNIGQIVNLELPLQIKDRLGGHFVQGHVDGTANIVALSKKGKTAYLTLEMPASLMPYIMLHGSICLDGVSLTVAKINKHQLTIMLMAYTLDHTNLSTKNIGDQLNVEVDMLAKYVHSLLENQTPLNPASKNEIHAKAVPHVSQIDKAPFQYL
jgi:riboflavin synthase